MKKILTLTLSLALILSATTACAINNEQGESSDGDPPIETTSPDNTQNAPQPPKAILADLNDDGKDDKIFITVDEDKKSATISIVKSNDGSEVFSETISVDSDYKCVYYLLAAKDHNPDRLLFFRYQNHPNDMLTVEYAKINITIDGMHNIIEGDKTFNVGPDVSMVVNNRYLETILSDINKMILPSFTTNGFLLIDNRGEELVYSTADDMIAAKALSFTLEDIIE